MKRTRGSTLIAMLLILSIMLILGMGLLGSRVARYRAATDSIAAAQAQALAEAGIADARAKLDKHQQFPPAGEEDEQLVFSYAEEVTEPGGQRVGSYIVTIDRRWSGEPYFLIVVESLGILGSTDDPEAQRVIRTELDISTPPSEWISWTVGAGY